jgi:hypothetical protein
MKPKITAVKHRRFRIQKRVKPERIAIVLRDFVKDPRFAAVVKPLLAGVAEFVISKL